MAWFFGIYMFLLFVHFIADFVLQTDWQAKNKSKSLVALGKHVSVYTLTLGVASLFLFGISINVFIFILVNGILHFVTDFFTSRMSSHYFSRQDWHTGFIVVGFDQFVHQITLALTMLVLLFGGS